VIRPFLGGAADDALRHAGEWRAVARRVLLAMPPRGDLERGPAPDYVPVGRSIRAWCATWCDIIGAHGVVRTAHGEKAFAVRRGIGGQ
jgi:hypothetical protein